jgi:hypothetical protein
VSDLNRLFRVVHRESSVDDDEIQIPVELLVADKSLQGAFLNARELMAAAGADGAEIPKLLLYDSINRLSGRTRLNMATPLLAGMRKAIPDLRNLVGAGLVGDMAGEATFQWFDDAIAQQSAMALAFSPRIGMHSVILRGASPVGGYHTVTRAEGPAVMEIDGSV